MKTTANTLMEPASTDWPTLYTSCVWAQRRCTHGLLDDCIDVVRAKIEHGWTYGLRPVDETAVSTAPSAREPDAPAKIFIAGVAAELVERAVTIHQKDQVIVVCVGALQFLERMLPLS